MRPVASHRIAHLDLLEPRLLLSAWFVDVSGPSGLDEILDLRYAHAAAWGDVNNNGLPDLFFGAWSYEGPNRLLLNNGDGTFSESVQASINQAGGRTSGSVFVDLNNNGWLDLVVMNNATAGEPPTNQLLMNMGGGVFVDVTAGSGLATNSPSRNPFVLDYDGDGLLDLILQSCRFFGQAGTSRTYLMRNNGDMTFTNVTGQAGLPTAEWDMVGLGGAVGDINGDGWPDFLHVGINDNRIPGRINYDPNITLWINNRDGTFHQSTTFNFNATIPPRTNNNDWVCGAALGDLNGDGRMDLVIGHHRHMKLEPELAAPVRAYLNLGNNANGDPLWQDITVEAGLHAINVRQPNIDLQDFNNDGLIDIWNGMTIEHIESGQQMPYIQFNLGNNANGVPQFAPMPGLMPPTTTRVFSPDGRGLVNPRYYAASPTADFNRDGKMNIFGADWSETESGPGMNDHGLWHNLIAGDDYIAIKIDQGEGTANRYGVGARVTIYEPGQAGNPAAYLGSHLVELANGYCSGREAIAHFGVPGRDFVDVVVEMPHGGPTYTSMAVATRQYVVMPHLAPVVPPAVDSVVINHGSTMRSELIAFEVAFTQNVALPTSAVQLWNHATGSQVDLSAAILTATSGSSYLLNVTGISLPNGWYTLRLVGDEISNANGAMDADFDLLTHRLAGDANGDAKVNVDDLGILATNYRTWGNWWTLNADFTLNGVVDVDDLGVLATNYRNELAPPAPLPAAEPMMVAAAQADDETSQGEVMDVQYVQQPTRTGEPLLAEMQLASPALLEGTAGDEPADITTVIAEDAEEETADLLAMLQPIA